MATHVKAKRSPTPRQRKAAKAIVENLQSATPIPTGQVLESVGYGFGLANSPHRVLEGDGFKQALREMGLTEELVTTSLVEDIKEKPQARLGELRLAAEILGINKREDAPPAPSQGGNTYNFLFSPESRAEVAALEERIKARLLKQNESI